MATTRKAELNALLNPIQRTVSGLTSAVQNTPSFGFGAPTDAGGWGMAFFSFAMALFVIFICLLVIHYTITPIFSFTGGDGGILPLSNTTDGQLVWTKAPPLADVSANVIRILPHGITIQQDIYIQNETTLTNRKRVFFYRSSSPVVPNPSQPENLIQQYPESNLFMYLSDNTNDLIVTAITKKPDNSLVYESTPTILNVPTKQVFRLTVVFLPQLLEVYLNGKLHGTHTFRHIPISTPTYFFSTPDAFRNSVRVMNFKYWDRPITSTEVARSSPLLADSSLFGPDSNTDQCN
jgi:hypothetical protein